MPKTIRARRTESPAQFAERVAAALAEHDSADFGMGPLCKGCTPFACPESRVAEILVGSASCYNCGI